MLCFLIHVLIGFQNITVDRGISIIEYCVFNKFETNSNCVQRYKIKFTSDDIEILIILINHNYFLLLISS